MAEDDYSGGRAVVLAAAATALGRDLSESAGRADWLHSIVEATWILSEASELSAALGEGLHHVGQWLDRQAGEGRIGVPYGPYAGHSDEAVGVVLAYLETVCAVLGQAAVGLRAAHVVAEMLQKIEDGADLGLNAPAPHPGTSTDVDGTTSEGTPKAAILPFRRTATARPDVLKWTTQGATSPAGPLVPATSRDRATAEPACREAGDIRLAGRAERRTTESQQGISER